MNEVRKNLPPMPDRIKSLPVSDKGYPIPWFVKWIDGVPDFRITDDVKMLRCLREQLCQICSQKLGRYKIFIGGPLMLSQRISLEPAMHRDCATWAVQACPFMVLPKAKKRIAGLPDDVKQTIKANDDHFRSENVIQLENNPGVFGIYTTTGYGVDSRRAVITLGEPVEIQWFSEGKPCGDDVAQAYMVESIERLKREHQIIAEIESAAAQAEEAS